MSKTGKLILTATPIGNLGDLTHRAEEALGAADLVVAEDTRRTGRLLQHLGLSKPQLSFFEGNIKQRIGQIIERIEQGQTVCLVSDAGSPLVSDPGYELVYACLERDLAVEALPGPCAAVLALQLSGLPPDRFIFEGFLPRKEGARRERFAAWRYLGGTLVLYESPNRLLATLEELLTELGDRPCAVLREMTKLHEEAVRGPLSYAIDHFTGRDIKGEVTVVVRLPQERAADEAAAVEGARALMRELGLKTKQAATAAALLTGADKKSLYRILAEDNDER
ncbi:MAG TPA: 16S rRNA (cytidine(1402)-2'-O)-methyltransferase [bacterium]|nr:16S rRNA (cytidine(1402)-2'-O)-methyltransferase [bacterium]